MPNSVTLDTLRDDLDSAHKNSAINYYCISKVDFGTKSVIEEALIDDEYDIYIGICTEYYINEELMRKLRMYLRKRYGHLIRALVIEPYDQE